MWSFLKKVLLATSSAAPGLPFKKLVTLLIGLPILPVATPASVVKPATVAIVLKLPPEPPDLGNARFATPLTSMPVALPIWSFNKST